MKVRFFKQICFLFLVVWSISLYPEEIQPFIESYSWESKGDWEKATYPLLSKSDLKNDYFANLRLGYINLLLYKGKEAIQFYQKASILEPTSIESKLGLMKAYQMQEQRDLVKQTCQTILKLDPKNYTARSSLAYAYFLDKSYGLSESTYLQIVKDYPADSEMLIGLALSQLYQGKKKEAKYTYEKAIIIVPYDGRLQFIEQNLKK